MKNLSIILVGCFLLASLVGCETTRGMGKDVENTGENIQDAVEKNR